MAEMIPDSIPSKASQGEKTLYTLLRDGLPDDFMVWYEPRVKHLLFSGVAGSGKTLILLARAKALANRLTEHRILILCFNITLASHLRSLLHSDDRNPQYRDRIEVRHFHDWARSLMGRLPNFQEFDNDNECKQPRSKDTGLQPTSCQPCLPD